jgi:hypothetical protein
MAKDTGIPEGCKKNWSILHPSGVHAFSLSSSGGLRFAPTTGYYLATLRVTKTKHQEVTF